MEKGVSVRLERHKVRGTRRAEASRVIVATLKGEGAFLGSGREGAISLRDIIVKRGEKERIITMAVKELLLQENFDTRGLFRDAFESYRIARELHLPTLPTFRFDERKNILIMTDWSEGGLYCVAEGHENDFPVEGVKPIAEITNIESLLDVLFSAAIRAAKHRCVVASDTYFFRFPKTGGSVPVDVILGDMGGLFTSQSENPEPMILVEENLIDAYEAFMGWFVKFAPDKSTLLRYARLASQKKKEMLESASEDSV